MAFSGGLLSLALGAFCLLFDVLASFGRLLGVCLQRLSALASPSGTGHPGRAVAVVVVVVAAVLALIGVTAEVIEGYAMRDRPPPQAFEGGQPEPRRASGRVVARATIDRLGARTDDFAAPYGVQRD
jgi:hypothetical protein